MVKVKAKKKRVYLEILRIISAFLVIFNHEVAFSFYYKTHGASQIIFLILSIITTINIPIFFMISGTLLLNKQEDYKTVFKKRISKFLIVLLLFSVITYLLRYWYGEIDQISLGNFIRSFVGGKVHFSYWFMYAYLGFLLMLPLLQRITAAIKKQDFNVLFILHLIIFTIIPLIDLFFVAHSKNGFRLSSDFNAPLATIKAFFYPIVGYYIDQKINIKKVTRKNIISMLFVLVGCFVVTAIAVIYAGNRMGYDQRYLRLFDYLISIIVFLLVKIFCEKVMKDKYTKLSKFLCLIGSLTFGIYLLHPVQKIVFSDDFHYAFDVHNNVDILLINISWCFIAFIGSAIVVYLFKKIPGIKKII